MVLGVEIRVLDFLDELIEEVILNALLCCLDNLCEFDMLSQLTPELLDSLLLLFFVHQFERFLLGFLVLLLLPRRLLLALEALSDLVDIVLLLLQLLLCSFVRELLELFLNAMLLASLLPLHHVLPADRCLA